MTHSFRDALHSQEENDSKTIFGFWVYLMTDCVLFATLFAAYAVLVKQTFGGPSGRELFSLPFALTETLILLVSSFFSGFFTIAAKNGKKYQVLFWMALVFLMGIAFMVMELTEFTHLVEEGNSWRRSAYLSSFFTLVGCHGLHISFGLLWMLFLAIQILCVGLNADTHRRLHCLKMFWHFLDIIWIFIFSIVFLIGTA